jgi:hypothetical protein
MGRYGPTGVGRSEMNSGFFELVKNNSNGFELT